MINKLDLFKQIVREGNYDNTYKMAWARSLVEIASEVSLDGDSEIITLKQIAEKFIKYYWDQTIFFDLIQGSNPKKPPVILTLVKNLISEYYKLVENKMPELFGKIVDSILRKGLSDKYNKTVGQVASVLKNDVSWRFLFLNDKYHDEIYAYNKGDDALVIGTDLLKELHGNEQDLYDLINYRWGLILETFNSSPRINKKVKIMEEREVKRNSLVRFKKYLDLENEEHDCFICGKKIIDNQLSIDHVIPWSYMYSDDIWNLVYVHKSCNSKKTNRIPDKEAVDKLKERNIKLLDKMVNARVTKKVVDELALANERDYVNKFWIGSKS